MGSLLPFIATMASLEANNSYYGTQKVKRVVTSTKRKWVGPYGIIVEALNSKQAVILIKKQMITLGLNLKPIKPKLYQP